MDRVPRERRVPRAVLAILAMLGLAASAQPLLAPGAVAVANTCRARNLSAGTPADSNLQHVIGAAASGDMISVKYRCVGHFHIGKRLTLIGHSTADTPLPILDGNDTGRVLHTSGQVKLVNLKVTGGLSAQGGGGIYNTGNITLIDTVISGNKGELNAGGGIYNANGTVTLRGASAVRANKAPSGGGIYSSGTLTLNDSSVVSGNVSHQQGGGIYAENGTVTLNGASSVSGNSATHGGGIYLTTTLILNDSSSVIENTSVSDGGGILIESGTVSMSDSSAVTGNVADSDKSGFGAGGGIDIYSGCLIGVVDGGNVNHNYLGNGTEDNIAGTSVCG